MSARRVALLGAESTGKTRLATELADALRARGMAAVAVPEVLREWCTREGRSPRPQEQLAIAREQEQRVEAAVAAGAQLVVADTTALMVAIYAGMLYEDGELLRFALERQRRYDATLVTGLDIAWAPDGLQREAASPREQVDALVRALLQQAALPYQVVYGQGSQRLQSALQALAAAGVLAPGVVERAGVPDAAGSAGAGKAWTWSCDKCSDPACEHRLFSRLKGREA